MMYYLHNFSTEFGVLNVFKYQTFRAMGAAVTSFLLCIVFGNWVIRRLISLKLGQPIRTQEEVHQLAALHGGKKGTPTMGGVMILGAVFASALLWAYPQNYAVWLVLFSMLFLGGLGFADDYLKVKHKKSDGISGPTKLVAQGFLAAIVTAFFLLNPKINVQARSLFVPFMKTTAIADMGLLTFFFFALVIVGTSNAVNLTDGLDGLASGCASTAAFSFAVLTYICGNVRIATYLGIPYYYFAGEISVICMALVGACLGFLWFNCHPARVFMGDTGSLAIGGMLGVISICCKQEMLLMVVGGVFVLEAVSVLIQRGWFKITKKRFGEGRRIFRMAPLHHHFELGGLKENTVIVRFWILSIVFAVLALATLKIR